MQSASEQDAQETVPEVVKALLESKEQDGGAMFT